MTKILALLLLAAAPAMASAPRCGYQTPLTGAGIDMTPNSVNSTSSVTASAFFGDGSHLVGVPSTGSIVGVYLPLSGGTMTGQLVVPNISAPTDVSSLTVTGAGGIGSTYGVIATTAAFGSGATISTFTTAGALNLASGASVTVSGAAGYLAGSSSATAAAFFGDGSHLTGIPSTGSINGVYAPLAGATFTGASGITNVAFTATGANGNIISASSITTTAGVFSNAEQIGGAPTTPRSVLDVTSAGTTVLTMSSSTIWVPVWTGFSSSPSIATSQYFRIGKLIVAWWDVGSAGTSNNTAHTITLPVAANVGRGNAGYVACKDNGGTTTLGRIDTANASTTASLYTGPPAGAWTASGSSYCTGWIIYEGQ